MSDESTRLASPPSPASGPPRAASRTLRLDLEYDGTDYVGWQFQPGQRSVQGTLEAVARKILDEPRACVIAAGRTDSGAHALGQVAHIRTGSRIPAPSFCAGMNSALPRDLRVRAVSEAAADFHARFSATGKEYRYQFWQGGPVPPFLRNYCLGVRDRLDVAAMAQAAALLEGTHDMSSFRASHCNARSPERTIDRSLVGEHGQLVVYAIASRGFLQHMVRILAGTLLQVGRGRLHPPDVERIRAERNRAASPPTAPAHGLFLVRVLYGGQLDARAEPVLTLGKLET